MKNSFFLLFILLSLNVLKGQQYVVNTSVDSTFHSGAYIYPIKNCTQQNSVNIRLDPSLFNYVTGLQFVIIIDSVHFGGPMNGGPLHSGDSIFLSSSRPAFEMSSIYSGSFWFKIKLIGTPVTVNQSYPCKIDVALCTCYCLDIVIKKSSTNSSMCNVGLFNKIDDVIKKDNFDVYPNPAINNFTISNIIQKSTIRLYNSLGEIITEKEINSDYTFDTNKLPNGIYTLIVNNKSDGFILKKIVIENK